jgi:hypothetical protein
MIALTKTTTISQRTTGDPRNALPGRNESQVRGGVVERRHRIGYDLRACEIDYAVTESTSARRLIYLLRQDIKWPLSVDTLVWPSLFHYSSYMEPSLVPQLHLDPADERQAALHLWSDVDDMSAVFMLKKSAAPMFGVHRDRCALSRWHSPVAVRGHDGRAAIRQSAVGVRWI